jgi:hypothetical protein
MKQRRVYGLAGKQERGQAHLLYRPGT